MNLKTLFCACFIFQNMYFTNSSESDNVIGAEKCILKNKSQITDADKLKKQYTSERGYGIQHIWRSWRGGWTFDLHDLNVDQLTQVCRCFAGVYYNLNTESVPRVNKDFLYATESFPWSWFGKLYVEGVIQCEFPGIKTFYLAASGKYYTELHHLGVYVFELSEMQSRNIRKRENPEKFVIKYPNGQFKALYPKINLTEYFEKINLTEYFEGKNENNDEVIIISNF